MENTITHFDPHFSTLLFSFKWIGLPRPTALVAPQLDEIEACVYATVAAHHDVADGAPVLAERQMDHSRRCVAEVIMLPYGMINLATAPYQAEELKTEYGLTV